MKLIIDIPEERYKSIKQFGIKQNEVYMLEKALISGTPLEDIKAEIKDLHKSHMINFVSADGAVDTCLEVIDKHIGGEE